ncbi:hypothetical protein K438DRAFT_1761590 [Mycena galopus ATCC 62051]|nr:hypothetical protein K438DRAFT_1761590 [Mycena galopus ATCC 62051]
MSASHLASAGQRGPARKRLRACDRYRRQKRECNGSLGDRNFKPTYLQGECTYEEPPPTRNSAFDDASGFVEDSARAYAEALERRLETVEKYLRRLQQRRSPNPPLYARAIRNLVIPFSPPHPDDSGFIDLAESFRALSLDRAPQDPGYQGPSSPSFLVKAAVEVKRAGGHTSQVYCPNPSAPVEVNGGREHLESRMHQSLHVPRPWVLKPVGPHLPRRRIASDTLLTQWENRVPIQLQVLGFAADHHLASLISLYFLHVNSVLPVLHRPGFEDRLSSVHWAHSTCLNRKSRDGTEKHWRGNGKMNFAAILSTNNPRSTIFKLTACASSPRFAWAIVGFGVRIARDIGSHRRSVRGPITTTEEELEKRACWQDPLVHGHPFKRRSGAIRHTRSCRYTLQQTHLRLKSMALLTGIAGELDSALDKWFSTIPEHPCFHPWTIFYAPTGVAHSSMNGGSFNTFSGSTRAGNLAVFWVFRTPHRTVLEHLISEDQDPATAFADDPDTDPDMHPGVYSERDERSDYAHSSFVPASTSNETEIFEEHWDDARDMFPPALVGDEEILPGRLRRPLVL